MAALIDEYKQAIQDVLDGRAKPAPKPSELPWTEDKAATMWAAAAAELIAEDSAGGGSSGGGVLIVTEDGGTGELDKTWQEIHDAQVALIVNVVGQNYKSFVPVIEVNEDSGSYTVTTCVTFNNSGEATFSIGVYAASSADGYPVAE